MPCYSEKVSARVCNNSYLIVVQQVFFPEAKFKLLVHLSLFDLMIVWGIIPPPIIFKVADAQHTCKYISRQFCHGRGIKLQQHVRGKVSISKNLQYLKTVSTTRMGILL